MSNIFKFKNRFDMKTVKKLRVETVKSLLAEDQRSRMS